jgi:hypothetical protein
MNHRNANGPPGPKKSSGRPEDRPERHREKDIDTEIVSVAKPFAKRLLDQWGKIWLFEIREGQRVRYAVEEEERRREFKLLFSARGKFERQAAKQGHAIGKGGANIEQQ